MPARPYKAVVSATVPALDFSSKVCHCEQNFQLLGSTFNLKGEQMDRSQDPVSGIGDGVFILGILILIALIFCSAPFSAAMENNAEKEILHLFEYLKKSNCEFNRNGSWYSPDEAVKHLKTKYRY